jgi:hypothetical protein
MLLAVIFPLMVGAQEFQYDLSIKPENYLLKIRMSFTHAVTLGQVKNNFKNGLLLTQVSSSIRSVESIPSDQEQYQLKMKVRSFGIGSILISDCVEKSDPSTWQRACQLRTDLEDGGTYMEWKRDTIVCHEDAATRKVECEVSIEGLCKAVRFLGFTIVSGESFTIRAKHPALYNFSRLWWFTNEGSISIRSSIAEFDHSELRRKIDSMLDQGLKILRHDKVFADHGEFKITEKH